MVFFYSWEEVLGQEEMENILVYKAPIDHNSPRFTSLPPCLLPSLFLLLLPI